MKNLHFLVSEYAEQIRHINQKTRPYTIIAVIANCALVGGALWLFTHNKSVLQDVDGDTIFFVVGSPLLLLGLYFNILFKKAEKEFWQTFSEKNSGVYTASGNPTNEQAVLFREGNTQTIKHVIVFEEEKHTTRIFQYSFTIGRGKNVKIYNYTVITVTFQRPVPHLYLNYRGDGYGVSVGESVPLPQEFERDFIVSIPKGYHIEALEIFTPEILATILDLGIKVDIEIVGNQIYFFIKQQQSFGMKFKKHLQTLEEKYTAVTTLMRLLKPRLDRFTFTQVGNLPHTL